MWAALRRAHLAPVVEASSMGLDMILSEGGAPLSAGQKQLIALARAVLRRAKVCGRFPHFLVFSIHSVIGVVLLLDAA